nr:MAG TPA: hypothetical protein [Caudoviricetes sp.]
MIKSPFVAFNNSYELSLQRYIFNIKILHIYLFFRILRLHLIT